MSLRIQSSLQQKGLNDKTICEGKQLLFQKHFSTLSLPDRLKSNLGKYYTPPHLVNLVKKLVTPYVKSNSIIMDLAAGCGAFLDCFPSNPVIIRDIDEEAVKFLKSIGYSTAEVDNSLADVHLSKYGLSSKNHLVCIGNPPYNDITSLVKRKGANTKKDIDFAIDADIKTSDLGTSFLRAFNKLEADVVCILHPLSYLIKESNFQNRLGIFTKEYRLQRGVIFSNNEFTDTKGTPFPVVAALYLRNFLGMDYEYIRYFSFEILDSEETFVLADYETTDGYINKYAPKRTAGQISDMGLYMHNFRDLNSLKSIGNLFDKMQAGVTLPVQERDFYKYAYLNALRHYFPKNFKWGNLSPLVIKEQLENDIFLQDACSIDTIIKNRRLACFSLNPPTSFMQRFMDKMKTRMSPPDLPLVYEIFKAFWENDNYDITPLENYLKAYFINLPEEMRKKKNAQGVN